MSKWYEVQEDQEQAAILKQREEWFPKAELTDWAILKALYELINPKTHNHQILMKEAVNYFPKQTTSEVKKFCDKFNPSIIALTPDKHHVDIIYLGYSILFNENFKCLRETKYWFPHLDQILTRNQDDQFTKSEYPEENLFKLLCDLESSWEWERRKRSGNISSPFSVRQPNINSFIISEIADYFPKSKDEILISLRKGFILGVDPQEWYEQFFVDHFHHFGKPLSRIGVFDGVSESEDLVSAGESLMLSGNNSFVVPKNDSVFLSYSHDSPEHIQRVNDLSAKLRSDGIQTVADFYVTSPSEGWPNWMEMMIKRAKYTLVVSSAGYVKKIEEYDSKQGKGVKWESGIITQEIYDAGNKNERFIAVHYGDAQNLPSYLKSYTHYDLTKDHEYEKLYARLTGQFPKPHPIGVIRKPKLNLVASEVISETKSKKIILERKDPDECKYCGFHNSIGVHMLPEKEESYNSMNCPECKYPTIPICAIGMGHFIYVCENCGSKWSNI